MPKFTNTTEKTPLGIGALGLLIEPGASVSVSIQQMHKAAESAVVRHWVQSGMLVAEEGDGDGEAEAERVKREAEELAALEAAEAERVKREAEEEAAAKATAGGPPKVPTPTPKR